MSENNVVAGIDISEIDARVDAFVDGLFADVRGKIVEHVAAKVTMRFTDKVIDTVAKTQPKIVPNTTPAPAAPVAGPSGKRAKSPAKKVSGKGGATRYDLDEAEVLEFIQKAGADGTNAEKLRATFGVSSVALSRRLGALLDSKKIRKTGKLRGTKYFVK